MTKKTCGVYIHIPFCLQKCYYCDFPSYDGLTHLFDEYVSALCNQIKKSKTSCFDYTSVFFGGGTPTILSSAQLENIVFTLKKAGYWQENAEKTCEINPETATEDKLLALKKLGFNRLSFGVQTFSDSLLKTIGRVHDSKTAQNVITLARNLGFDNINIDLMFALPNQTLADVKASIDKAVSLDPTHISMYELILEEETLLDDFVRRGKLFLPDDNLQEQMYDFVTNYLNDNGYNRYEISNYCKKGYECQHNLQYWHYKDYIAFGAGSTSFIHNERTTNTFDVQEYINSFLYKGQEKKEIEQIYEAIAMAEFVFMGLRTTEGIDPNDFYRRFNKDIFKVYDEQLQIHKNNSHIVINDRISLTNQGMKIGNKIFLTFLPLNT